MPRINLDTHILIFALENSLRKRERDLLSESEWSISPIVFWELSKLTSLGRVDIDLGDPLVNDLLLQLHVWPLSLDVARLSNELDFAADPADELIAATSIVYNTPLLTRDTKIRSSRLVPFA